jgi:hypothetical protein
MGCEGGANAHGGVSRPDLSENREHVLVARLSQSSVGSSGLGNMAGHPVPIVAGHRVRVRGPLHVWAEDALCLDASGGPGFAAGRAIGHRGFLM